MKPAKQLGIWMDHSKANIMELLNDKIVTTTLLSNLAFTEQVQNLRMDEILMQNKEQKHQSDFYKKISSLINNYTEVLLFGPNEAKTELFNLIKNSRQFENIKMTVQPSDNMTTNQQQDFVRYFYRNENNA